MQVITEFQVAPKPPLGNVLILRPEGDAWTEAQRERLPDGIRHSRASHILLEFKYSESVNDAAMRQAVMVDALYRRAKTLPEEDERCLDDSTRDNTGNGEGSDGHPLPLRRILAHGEL